MKAIVLVVVLIAFAIVTFARYDKAAAAPLAGEMAPDFTAPSQDGSPVSLKDFRGKWVVLYFYPKDGTHGCTIEAHNFQRDIAKYEVAKAVVIGVSVDSANSHQEFCTKQGLTFKLIADTDKTVSRAYGSVTNLVVTKIASRNTFLIDPQGTIAKVWLGVDPGKHSEEVLAELSSHEHQWGADPPVRARSPDRARLPLWHPPPLNPDIHLKNRIVRSQNQPLRRRKRQPDNRRP
jgi:peroxiredoxin Q/BCP